jgi:hypothetical protein
MPPWPSTGSYEPAPLVAVELDLDDFDGCAGDARLEREASRTGERFLERCELLRLSIGV